MGLRQRLLAGTARQLGHPSGLRGRFIVRTLNRVNRELVEASAVAAGVGPGQEAADIGFGGGVGLKVLLDATAPAGTVHGVDISTTAVARGEREFAGEIAAGRVRLAVGSLLDLPLADDALDALITTNTVYFLDDVGPAFREIARVLRPGGRAVIGISDPDQMAQMPVASHGFHLRPVPDLLDAMAAAGLRQVRADSMTAAGVKRYLLIGEI